MNRSFPLLRAALVASLAIAGPIAVPARAAFEPGLAAPKGGPADPGYVSPEELVASALADASGLPKELREQTRYFTLGEVPIDYRAEVIRILAVQINNLSRNSELIPPRIVRPDGALLAVVCRDYRWDLKTFGRLADTDPFYHLQTTVNKETKAIFPKELPDLVKLGVLCDTRCPVVRGVWFFVQTCRQLSLTNKQTGAGYYDFIGVKNRKDFDDLTVFDRGKSKQIGKDQKAALEKSGVAQQGRQIEILKSLTGTRYTTLDTDDNTGKGNPINNLKDGEYQHKAEEHYSFLPNGLFAFLLCDAQGQRQDSAPDFIGFDESPNRVGRDGRIHICLACIRCHTTGLQDVNDWVRRTVRPPLALQAVALEDFENLRRQFFVDYTRQINLDRQAYAGALLEISGFTPEKMAAAYAKLYNWYAERLWGTEDIAAGMGITKDQLTGRLKKFNAQNGFTAVPVLAGLLKNPEEPLRTTHMEEVWPILTALPKE